MLAFRCRPCALHFSQKGAIALRQNLLLILDCLPIYCVIYDSLACGYFFLAESVRLVSLSVHLVHTDLPGQAFI